MRRICLALYLCSAFLVASTTFPAGAQSGAVIPQGGAGHADKASCVILKRMGPADQVTSHLYSFGIRGKQFQYVEGKLPEGFPFHGRLTDHDVRNLQGRGAEVLMLESHYTAEDLKQARDQCKGMTGATPNQASVPEIKSVPGDASANTQTVSGTPVLTQAALPSVAAPTQASITIDSTPAGADIEVDGNFMGNTPSTIAISSGSHEIAVKKKGYENWTRKLNVTAGSVHLNAELEAATK
jgi:hypothetical protein